MIRYGLFIFLICGLCYSEPDENVLKWKPLKRAMSRVEYFNEWIQSLHENGYLHERSETTPSEGQNWAVLVAGSNGWYNYRHQADICHAYHLLRSHGIPETNIITMMYDDIADNPQNPNKGVIINRPNGTNVYKGVVIDYRTKDVTPENFLKILTGSSELIKKGKRVLKSGPNDRVFIYFSDHGAPGLLAFPSNMLHADDLSRTLKTMNQKKMYKEMVFYIEACESGSMFEHGLLPNSLKIYGLTAANDNESSWACYLDDELENYLGDCFSVNWMEDSEAHKLNLETLESQYENVKVKTTQSHVMQYGDLTITTEDVGEFQGNQSSNSMNIPLSNMNKQPVPQDDVELRILLTKARSNKNGVDLTSIHKDINALIAKREKMTSLFDRVIALVTKSSGKLFYSRITARSGGPIDFQCYKPVLQHFSNVCEPLNANSLALSHLYKFANLCRAGVPSSQIIQAISNVCE